MAPGTGQRASFALLFLFLTKKVGKVGGLFVWRVSEGQEKSRQILRFGS